MPLDGRLVLRRPHIKGLCGEGPEKSALAHPGSHCYHTPTGTVHSEGFVGWCMPCMYVYTRRFTETHQRHLWPLEEVQIQNNVTWSLHEPTCCAHSRSLGVPHEQIMTQFIGLWTHNKYILLPNIVFHLFVNSYSYKCFLTLQASMTWSYRIIKCFISIYNRQFWRRWKDEFHKSVVASLQSFLHEALVLEHS